MNEGMNLGSEKGHPQVNELEILASRPQVVQRDAWLAPYESAVRQRRERFYRTLSRLQGRSSRLSDMVNGHHYFGLHQDENGQVLREWAPGAADMFLIGDFNGWNRRSHPLSRLAHGNWEMRLPIGTLKHGTRYKLHVVSATGGKDRIPPYARRVVQDQETHDFAAEVWLPERRFAWNDQGFSVKSPSPRFIYEAHVGMALEDERIGSFREFADQILARIVASGYDTLQLMAAVEHPYYGSFGYHVANFFAPSSRFGTPHDLCYLIDRAHALDVAVVLDVVHSHAAKNSHEGLAGFDGTDYQFFHSGPRGEHPLWDSKLFDYGKPEVVHFLLSNLKYWLEEFHFDGFRFDGVTSMLYLHHGIGDGSRFDHYDKYFVSGVDEDGVTYLQLANHLVHELRPDALTIAEDVSGMPGIAAPIAEGGIGFDYRLAMGLPDYWVNLVKATPDEHWSMQGMLHALRDRRFEEKHVAYVESHDQCLVGDQTLSFRLIGDNMYQHMRVDDADLRTERGIALHKMIRLATISAGGEAYLNFMGNEFGHPEWVDFPREGNGWSHLFARRQWSLGDNPDLRYSQLKVFDRAMLALMQADTSWVVEPVMPVRVDDRLKLMIFSRGTLLFAFNFHPHESYADFEVPLEHPSTLEVALDSDAKAFGGYGRIDPFVPYHPLMSTEARVKLYLPSRTAVVYRKATNANDPGPCF